MSELETSKNREERRLAKIAKDRQKAGFSEESTLRGLISPSMKSDDEVGAYAKIRSRAKQNKKRRNKPRNVNMVKRENTSGYTWEGDK